LENVSPAGPDAFVKTNGKILRAPPEVKILRHADEPSARPPFLSKESRAALSIGPNVLFV
jgi:hypothetical protein